MSEKKAMAEVEAKYGGLDNFVMHLLAEQPQVLGLPGEDGEEPEPLGIHKQAELCELSLETTSFILNRSPQFRAILRSDLVNRVFTLHAEQKHIEKVAKIAKGENRKVASPKGGTVSVDQIASDVIKAGEYLNKYRSTPIDDGNRGMSVGFSINFIGQRPIEDDIIEVEVRNAEEEAPKSQGKAQPALEDAGHKPSRAGDLPPSAARRYYREVESGKDASFYGEAGGPLDFYSDEAVQKARDQEIAEKKARTGHHEKPPGANGERLDAEPVPMDR